MRFIPNDLAHLAAALDLLPDNMPVEVNSSVGFVATDVAALRKIDPIPAGIMVGIPKQRMPDSVVKVDKLGDLLPAQRRRRTQALTP